jgi:hypothetical protein
VTSEPRLLILQKNDLSVLFDLFQILYRTCAEIAAVPFIRALKPVTGKGGAFETVFHPVAPQEKTLAFEVRALFVPLPASRAVSDLSLYSGNVVTVGKIPAADPAVHSAGGYQGAIAVVRKFPSRCQPLRQFHARPAGQRHAPPGQFFRYPERKGTAGAVFHVLQVPPQLLGL